MEFMLKAEHQIRRLVIQTLYHIDTWWGNECLRLWKDEGLHIMELSFGLEAQGFLK